MKTPNAKAIKSLRKQGMTFQEIGTRFGISRQRVHQILRGGDAAWKKLRAETIRDADALCAKCGFDGRWELGKLHVHHRDEDPSNDNPKNLEVLCTACHKEKHPNMGGPRGPVTLERLRALGWT